MKIKLVKMGLNVLVATIQNLSINWAILYGLANKLFSSYALCVFHTEPKALLYRFAEVKKCSN